MTRLALPSQDVPLRRGAAAACCCGKVSRLDWRADAANSCWLIQLRSVNFRANRSETKRLGLQARGHPSTPGARAPPSPPAGPDGALQQAAPVTTGSLWREAQHTRNAGRSAAAAGSGWVRFVTPSKQPPQRAYLFPEAQPASGISSVIPVTGMLSRRDGPITDQPDTSATARGGLGLQNPNGVVPHARQSCGGRHILDVHRPFLPG